MYKDAATQWRCGSISSARRLSSPFRALCSLLLRGGTLVDVDASDEQTEAGTLRSGLKQ